MVKVNLLQNYLVVRCKSVYWNSTSTTYTHHFQSFTSVHFLTHTELGKLTLPHARKPTANSSRSDHSVNSPGNEAGLSPFNRQRRPVSTLLLLTMFALAARYDETTTPLPSDSTLMWVAGDDYLDRAKIILDGTYTSSRASTCQALLLMGYREIGIGAMAQAWTYIGMAIRMAQDLGMHRSADGWTRADLGGRLFSEWELDERKRLWYGCVVMDKYVSAYIGMVFSTLDNSRS